MSNKATYLGALMDAGVRALGIAGGASIGRSLGGGRMLPTALGGVIGHDAASGLLQRMGRNQYVSVGRRGVKPAKVKKQIIINEEDNMSKSLTESLIKEGVGALREFNLKRLASNLGNAGDVRDIPGQGYSVVPKEYASVSPYGPGSSERINPDANYGTRDFYYGNDQAYFKNRKGNELSTYRDSDNSGYSGTDYGAVYGSGRGTAGYKQPSVGARLDSAAIEAGQGLRRAASGIGQAGKQLFGRSNRMGSTRGMKR